MKLRELLQQLTVYKDVSHLEYEVEIEDDKLVIYERRPLDEIEVNDK